MHFAFRNAGKQTDKELTLPYTCDVASRKAEVNWAINHTRYKTFGDWVLGAVRGMSILGIKNFCYSYPDKADGEHSRVRFHFANEGDKLRFMCMIHGNTQGFFKRKLFALNKAQASEWMETIDYFLKENGISGAVKALTSERLEITTYCRMDDLMLYQYAMERRMKLAHPPALLALEYAATSPRQPK